MQKLTILADAAKYDASCASSGSRRSRPKDGIGNAEGMGICHSYTPDGRCVSLLKILFTNYCIYDCLYCVNRVSSSVPRARFTIEEVVSITLDFYRRNYIEGLFLSSGIIQDPDTTMEQLVAVAKSLRTEHRFGGYIHLKAIPGASPELLEEAGRYADRLSANMELPRQKDLDDLAPAKKQETITGTMAVIKEGIAASRERPAVRARPPRFAPAGQSTQLIAGATAASDREILKCASDLYTAQKLRRVYYSAFSPIPESAPGLPSTAAPLVREHRLYQADWLIRFYGFNVDEVVPESDQNLNSSFDPKTAWALRNRSFFPVDINTAPKTFLLRVPGLGVRSVDKIVAARRHMRIRLNDLLRLRVSIKKIQYFIQTADHNPALSKIDSLILPHIVAPAPQQLSLFDDRVSVVRGEL